MTPSKVYNYAKFEKPSNLVVPEKKPALRFLSKSEILLIISFEYMSNFFKRSYICDLDNVIKKYINLEDKKITFPAKIVCH